MAETDQLFKRAEESFNKRNYDYARDLFMQILLLDPNHGRARRSLRATIVRKLQEQGPAGRFKMAMLKGQVEIHLCTQKDVQKRIEFCQKYLNEDPADGKVRTTLASMLLELGHHEGAAAEAEVCLENDSSNITAAKVLVTSYKTLGKVKEAQAILERVSSHLKDDRDLEKLQRDLAAMQSMKEGFEDAKTFRDVVKNVSQAEALEKRQHLIQTDEELQVVVESIERQMGENPTDANLPRKIGDLIFEKRKDYAVAQEWYQKAARLAPQDTVLRDKIDDCTLRLLDRKLEQAAKAGDPRLNEIKIERLKFALQSYERRVQDRPTDMGLRFELGRFYYLSGPAYMDRAITEFQQAVRDPKKKSDSHLYLGMAFQRKKMFDMADKQYALAEEGILVQDRLMSIYYNRAICNREAGNPEKAVEFGKKIMETDIGYKDIAQLVEKWQREDHRPA